MSDEEKGKAKGGKARAASLTADQRKAIAAKAAEARWGVSKATHTGELQIGDVVIPCAVLPDGTRVLSQRGVGKAIGRSYGGKNWSSKGDDGAGNLPFFVGPKSLIPFISSDLLPLIQSPIQYRHGAGGGVAHGVPASALPMICDVWLQAREAGILTPPQLAVAQKAEILVRGLAHVGVVALVDEATGYQEVRDKAALQAILDKYLRKELAAWAKRFPDDFYREIFRLRGWTWNRLRRPGIVAAYTTDFVYARLAPGIVEELEKLNPKQENGYRKAKHHQWLSDEIGHPALAQHIYAIIGLMRASENWVQFKTMLDRAYPKRDKLQLDLLY